jgi:hypothetical protein
MTLDLKDTISNNINKLMQKNNSTGLNEQSLIDKALIDAGLPENRINALIAMAKDKLTCDSDCQKTRTSENYKQKWELAKKQYEQAPEEIRMAEKNYYIFDKGLPAYNDMLFDRYAKNSQEFKKSSNEKHDRMQDEITSLLDNYAEGTNYLQRMNELLTIKLKENEKLKKQIDNYLKRTQTNGRKVIYSDRARDWLATCRQILIIVYFCVLIGYIVLGNFIPNREYVKIKAWIIIFLYIIFPFFILDRIVKFIFYIIGLLQALRINKNVYTNL